MSPRDPRVQAAALRLAAERVEHGGEITGELAEALVKDIAAHPEELEELEGFAAQDEPLPEWMKDELDWRLENDHGGEDGFVVMERLIAKLRARRQSA
jgi:hypothetical protein